MSSRVHRSYGGARAVSTVFKFASIFVIIGGVLVAIQFSHDQLYPGNNGRAIVGVIAGTIFTAAAVAFFAYVLDLLIGIERNTSSGRSARIAAAPAEHFPGAPPVASEAPVPAFGRPGWYADPQGLARVRFWDGRGWTDQTQS